VASGLLGESRGVEGRGERLTLGRAVFERPTIVVTRDTTGMLTRTDYVGLIGLAALADRQLVIDYPGARMVIRPERPPDEDRRWRPGDLRVSEPPIRTQRRSGPVMETVLVVEFVAHGS